MKRLGMGIFCLTLLALPAGAEPEDGGQKKYGVVHNIADDRQLERVGGIYEPEGLDKYMKRRFDGLGEQIGSVESRLAGLENQMAQILERLDAIEESASEGAKKKPSAASENPKPSAGSPGGRGVLVGASSRSVIVES